MVVLYNTRTWLGSVYHVEGTILEHILWPVAVMSGWTVVAYFIQLSFGITSTTLSPAVTKSFLLLGKFTCFFLIFRTNQAYRRFWLASDALRMIQISARELHQTYICYLKGGMFAKDPEERTIWEANSCRAKTDVTRYIIAFCLLLKIHSRVAYEGYMRGICDIDMMETAKMNLARVRGLLTEDEFVIVEEWMNLKESLKALEEERHRIEQRGWTAMGVPTCVGGRAVYLVVYFLVCLNRDCAIFAKEWGWLERVLNLADARVKFMLYGFEAMESNVSTPMPLPFNHIGKTCLFMWLLWFPLVLTSPDDGIIVSLISSVFISAILFGLEAIGMEIEDPWGDDSNDLDVPRQIGSVEENMYEIMCCRKDPSVDNFVWIRPPPEYCNGHVPQFLCLASEASALLQMWPECKTVNFKPTSCPTRPATTSLYESLSARTGAKATGPGCGASGGYLWRYDIWNWA